MSSKDKLENVAFGSEAEEEIQETIREYYLDPEFESKWKPAKIQIVQNENMLKRFEEKKQEFFVHGHKAEELDEKFGFVVENNVARLETICDLGLQTEDSEYNALGYNYMGVYLCRYSDVCLQHALVKYCGSNVIRLVLFKFLPGRQTTAIPRVASSAEFIEPTQGFDSHVSVIQPSCADSLQNQFDRSQIYLYEINKLLQPSSSPHQILPYALVTYTVDGIYHSAIDAEPTNAEKLATNTQLQLIVKQINARGNGMAPVESPQSPSSTVGKALAVGASGRAVSHLVSHSLTLHGSLLPGGQGGVGHGTGVKIGVPPQQIDHVSGSENAKLQRVISELNVKLGAEEMKKFSFGDVAGRGSIALQGTSLPTLNPEYMTRPLSVSLPGLVPAVGVLPAAGLVNVHPSVSSAAASFPSHVTGASLPPNYGLLKPGLSLSNAGTSQQPVAGFLGGIPGQSPVVSRSGTSDPAAAMAALAGYFSIPSAASIFTQNAVYPIDYVPTVLSPAKDNTGISAAGFYPIQTINPGAGYAMVSQAVKRPVSGDYMPYIEKRPKFF